MTCTMCSVKTLQLLLHTETGRYSRRFMQTLTCREALFLPVCCNQLNAMLQMGEYYSKKFTCDDSKSSCMVQNQV